MEDYLNKNLKMEDNLKKNGRQPQKSSFLKMEDDLILISMEDEL